VKVLPKSQLQFNIFIQQLPQKNMEKILIKWIHFSKMYQDIFFHFQFILTHLIFFFH